MKRAQTVTIAFFDPFKKRNNMLVLIEISNSIYCFVFIQTNGSNYG